MAGRDRSDRSRHSRGADDRIGKYFHLAIDRRPAEELYAIGDDPGCLRNLADDPDHRAAKEGLGKRLTDYLTKTGDARVTASDRGDVWETYPRYSRLRWFPEPDWVTDAAEHVPRQDWLEARRPK